VRDRAPGPAQRRAGHEDLGQFPGFQVLPYRFSGSEGDAQARDGPGDHRAARAEGEPGRVGFERGEKLFAVSAGRRSRLALKPADGAKQRRPACCCYQLCHLGGGHDDEQVRAGRGDNRVGDMDRRPAADDQVGLVRVEHRPDPLTAADLQPEVDVRVSGQERRERAGQEMLPRGRDGRDPDPSVPGVVPGPGGDEGFLVEAEDLASIAHVGPSGLGELQAPAVALHQRCLDLPGQRGEGGGHRRLGDSQAACRLAYRSGISDGHQRPQPCHRRQFVSLRPSAGEAFV
jgi:hypothetical protein